MINLENYEIFRNHKESLREISKDENEKGNVEYMTEAKEKAINFDSVKTKYTNQLGLSEENATSVDAITHILNGITFIEFKNGNMKNAKQSVKNKIRDSLLIFCDITGKTIQETREWMNFVLVYNLEKNPLSNQMTKNIVQESPSRDFIAKSLLEKGKEEFIRFDLERFRKLYFRDVHTYSKSEFEAYWERNKPVVSEI